MNELLQFAQDWESAMAKMPEWFQYFFGADSFWDFILRNSLQGVGVALVGWLVAAYLERRHIRNLDTREAKLKHISLSTAKTAPAGSHDPELLIASTVVAHDFFRTFFILFRKIFGGNFAAYDRLMMRGRREALACLKEQADAHGFNRVINIRFASKQVSTKPLSSVELVAYGTGIRSR